MNRTRHRILVSLAAMALAVLGTTSARAARAKKVDLNSATQAELEALPGVGAATAKKIIEGRPYSSVAGLSKAGLSRSAIEKISPLVTVRKGSGRSAEEAAASARETKKAKKETSAEKSPAAAPSGPIDLNTASEKDLESLPGVGAATAKKIVAGRPYSSVSDLGKAGVSSSTIQKISPLVTVGAARPAKSARSTGAAAESAAGKGAPAAAGPVDLNKASQSELEALPGVGAATAKKIIEGRPYSSVADLARAGVSQSTIQKISPLVVARGAAASSRPPAPAASRETSAPPAPQAAPAREARDSGPEASAPYQAPPARGMVWVNTATRVYHYEGDRWYGRTKEGKYMTEQDAIAAGYRPSKQKVAGEKP
ncbi:MAG: ComEA family DNA-binding protein [Acidobacteriota bacterium]